MYCGRVYIPVKHLIATNSFFELQVKMIIELQGAKKVIFSHTLSPIKKLFSLNESLVAILYFSPSPFVQRSFNPYNVVYKDEKQFDGFIFFTIPFFFLIGFLFSFHTIWKDSWVTKNENLSLSLRKFILSKDWSKGYNKKDLQLKVEDCWLKILYKELINFIVKL